MSRLALSCALGWMASASARHVKGGKHFDYLMIIQFENHAEDEVIKDPNFGKYREMGRSFLDYFAITHPSQPNYISQAAGSPMGISDDDVHHIPATEKNLADLLDDNHVSWKLYQEDYPGNCDDDAVIGRYARKHNQFISFDDVRLNATKCSKIVNSDQLDTDLAKNALPQYSYFTPNMDNDAHDTNITYAGKWLDQFFTNRLSKFPDSTLIVVTWDEDDYSEQNKVLTFMLDPKQKIVKPGTTDNTHYDHYCLLATIEDNWGLGNLGRNDKGAKVFNFGNLESVDIYNRSTHNVS